MSNIKGSNQNKSNNDTFNTESALSKVKAYYESSYKKLLAVFTIGMFFLVLFPAVASYISYISFDKTEKKLERRIENTQKSSIEKIKKLENRLEDSITSTEGKMTALQKDLREQIVIEVNSTGEELLQKTEKDLANAMAQNYMRIASTIPDIPNQPYWKLISVVVYIEAAVEYAKCDKQADLQYVLERAESEIAIKLSKKHEKSTYLRDVYRSMYSIMLRNIYDIRSIMEEKGYRGEYVFYLLDSLEQKAQNACEELDKEKKSKPFYFF